MLASWKEHFSSPWITLTYVIMALNYKVHVYCYAN